MGESSPNPISEEPAERTGQKKDCDALILTMSLSSFSFGRANLKYFRSLFNVIDTK
jgi:hypothetical protein